MENLENKSLLSILLGVDSFRIFNFLEVNTPSIQHDIKTLDDNYYLLEKKFPDLQLISLSSNFTLIPEVIFDSNQINEFLESTSNYVRNKGTRIVSEKIESQNSIILFDVPTEIDSKYEIRHISEFLIMTSISHSEENVAILIEDNYMFVIGVKSGNVIVANTYSFSSDTDILYFLLLVYSKRDFSQKDTTLIVCGDIIEDSKIFNNLKVYFKNIEFVGQEIYSIK